MLQTTNCPGNDVFKFRHVEGVADDELDRACQRAVRTVAIAVVGSRFLRQSLLGKGRVIVRAATNDIDNRQIAGFANLVCDALDILGQGRPVAAPTYDQFISFFLERVLEFIEIRDDRYIFDPVVQVQERQVDFVRIVRVVGKDEYGYAHGICGRHSLTGRRLGRHVCRMLHR
ncbi:MAG: hypothetical protein H6884_02295 [Rhodobiaceae bacterium]|nr:hypothetical protein [Rhodobiaceae bacterium]MCC0052871.1 hypothetical protein [Rhodobiaceae bacterium]